MTFISKLRTKPHGPGTHDEYPTLPDPASISPSSSFGSTSYLSQAPQIPQAAALPHSAVSAQSLDSELTPSSPHIATSSQFLSSQALPARPAVSHVANPGSSISTQEPIAIPITRKRSGSSSAASSSIGTSPQFQQQYQVLLQQHQLQKSQQNTEGKIFGVPLRVSIKYAYSNILYQDKNGDDQVYGQVPIIVAKCSYYLKKNAAEVEGIFRVSGSSRKIKELQELFSTPPTYGKDLNWEGFNVHSAANVLRRYLNNLPEPIIPLKFYEKFRHPLLTSPLIINYLKANESISVTDEAVVSVTTKQSSDNLKPDSPDSSSAKKLENSSLSSEALKQEIKNVVSQYITLIDSLPALNRQLLMYILDLLTFFASRSKINLMPAVNLAAIFQPSILSHPAHSMDPSAYHLSRAVTQFLIEQFRTIQPILKFNPQPNPSTSDEADSEDDDTLLVPSTLSSTHRHSKSPSSTAAPSNATSILPESSSKDASKSPFSFSVPSSNGFVSSLKRASSFGRRRRTSSSSTNGSSKPSFSASSLKPTFSSSSRKSSTSEPSNSVPSTPLSTSVPTITTTPPTHAPTSEVEESHKVLMNLAPPSQSLCSSFSGTSSSDGEALHDNSPSTSPGEDKAEQKDQRSRSRSRLRGHRRIISESLNQMSNLLSGRSLSPHRRKNNDGDEKKGNEESLNTQLEKINSNPRGEQVPTQSLESPIKVHSDRSFEKESQPSHDLSSEEMTFPLPVPSDLSKQNGSETEGSNNNVESSGSIKFGESPSMYESVLFPKNGAPMKREYYSFKKENPHLFAEDGTLITPAPQIKNIDTTAAAHGVDFSFSKPPPGSLGIIANPVNPGNSVNLATPTTPVSPPVNKIGKSPKSPKSPKNSRHVYLTGSYTGNDVWLHETIKKSKKQKSKPIQTKSMIIDDDPPAAANKDAKKEAAADSKDSEASTGTITPPASTVDATEKAPESTTPASSTDSNKTNTPNRPRKATITKSMIIDDAPAPKASADSTDAATKPASIADEDKADDSKKLAIDNASESEKMENGVTAKSDKPETATVSKPSSAKSMILDFEPAPSKDSLDHSDKDSKPAETVKPSEVAKPVETDSKSELAATEKDDDHSKTRDVADIEVKEEAKEKTDVVVPAADSVKEKIADVSAVDTKGEKANGAASVLSKKDETDIAVAVDSKKEKHEKTTDAAAAVDDDADANADTEKEKETKADDVAAVDAKTVEKVADNTSKTTPDAAIESAPANNSANTSDDSKSDAKSMEKEAKVESEPISRVVVEKEVLKPLSDDKVVDNTSDKKEESEKEKKQPKEETIEYVKEPVTVAAKEIKEQEEGTSTLEKDEEKDHSKGLKTEISNPKAKDTDAHADEKKANTEESASLPSSSSSLITDPINKKEETDKEVIDADVKEKPSEKAVKVDFEKEPVKEVVKVDVEKEPVNQIAKPDVEKKPVEQDFNAEAEKVQHDKKAKDGTETLDALETPKALDTTETNVTSKRSETLKPKDIKEKLDTLDTSSLNSPPTSSLTSASSLNAVISSSTAATNEPEEK